jgi:iron complex outermembrane receptor protein
VGVKTELGRLSSTLAFYNTTLSNILTTDPDNPNFSIQVGEQRSQGIEFDIAGELLPGWKVIAGYAYTNAEITKDNRFPVGNRLNNVPHHSASLWTTYTFQDAALKGFGIGAGVFYVGDRAGDLANSFEVPGYTRFDAAIFYEVERLRIALNFKNLSNICHFEGSQNFRDINPGAPFTVQGTISLQF